MIAAIGRKVCAKYRPRNTLLYLLHPTTNSKFEQPTFVHQISFTSLRSLDRNSKSSSTYVVLSKMLLRYFISNEWTWNELHDRYAIVLFSMVSEAI